MQNHKIKIRRVNVTDVGALFPLIAQLGYPIKLESLTARIALYQCTSNDIAWVALLDNIIVGCLALHIYDLFHCDERYARIGSLVVEKTHRRLGIGKLLVAQAEKYATAKQCSALELTSSLKRQKLGTYDFYAQLGYQNEGEYESRYLRKYLKPKMGPLL